MHSLTKITFLINIISHTSLIEASRFSLVTAVSLVTLVNYIQTHHGMNGLKFDLKYIDEFIEKENSFWEINRNPDDIIRFLYSTIIP